MKGITWCILFHMHTLQADSPVSLVAFPSSVVTHLQEVGAKLMEEEIRVHNKGRSCLSVGNGRQPPSCCSSDLLHVLYNPFVCVYVHL